MSKNKNYIKFLKLFILYPVKLYKQLIMETNMIVGLVIIGIIIIGAIYAAIPFIKFNRDLKSK